MFLNDKPYCDIGYSLLRSFINLFLSLVLEKVCNLVITFLEDIFSRHAVLHKCVRVNVGTFSQCRYNRTLLYFKDNFSATSVVIAMFNPDKSQ